MVSLLSVCVCVLYNNLLLSLQLVNELLTMTYHVRTMWCMVCVRPLNLKPTPSLLVHPPPLYKTRSMTTLCVMCRSASHQCMKVWKTRTINSWWMLAMQPLPNVNIYDDVNMRQWLYSLLYYNYNVYIFSPITRLYNCLGAHAQRWSRGYAQARFTVVCLSV